jgi:uncharacterized protein (TIGR02271 family)
MPGEKPRETIPVAREQLGVERAEVETGRLRIDKQVEQEPVELEVPISVEELEVERVPVDRVVDQAEGPRSEGDVTIVPVYEERVIAKKQLVLVEELRVRRVRSERVHRERVERRVEHVEVSRHEPNGSGRPEDDGGKER